MGVSDPATGRVLLIVVVVLGYALSITFTNRTLKRLGFAVGSTALFVALVKASHGDGLIPILYRWTRGQESWLSSVIMGNGGLFAAYLGPLADLALVFGVVAGIFAALGLLNVKLLQQIAWLAVVALLAAFVGGLATIRIVSAGFGGYGTHDVFFAKPAPDDILDGDTLHVGAVNIRLAGIDTPEFRNVEHPAFDRENQPCLVGGKLTACGKSARDALAALVVGKRVVCTRIASRGSDRFGRTIASCVVYAPDSGDFELSTYMAETGLAALADETQGLDPAYLHRIETDIQNAQSGTPKKGIWAGCMIKPERWRLQNNEGAQIRDGFVLGRWDPDNVIDPKACGR